MDLPGSGSMRDRRSSTRAASLHNLGRQLVGRGAWENISPMAATLLGGGDQCLTQTKFVLTQTKFVLRYTIETGGVRSWAAYN